MEFLANYVIPSGFGNAVTIFYNPAIPVGFSA